MLPVLDSFYALWRVNSGAVPVLREDTESPPERLLQTIWLHQRLRRDALQTLDGRNVQVFHPGFQNFEGGPDFRGAVLRIGAGDARSGDVEVDLRASGWRAHGHHRNAAFENVILHVIWEGAEPAAEAPATLRLRDTLDAPLGQLSLWLAAEPAHALPELWRGRCATPLKKLNSAQLGELLRQAAEVRLRGKAAQFQARARQAGWDQSLWEGLFRALGYKNNIWPMQRLAELRSQWTSGSPDHLGLQARLFGLSGLLPSELPGVDPAGDAFLRQVWDRWWRERDAFADAVLPRASWRLRGARPTNHPHRRLALATHWSDVPGLFTALETWCGQEKPPREAANSLLRLMQAPLDRFWSWHFTLHSRRAKAAYPLLGEHRATDLAINAVLPWLWARAAEGNNPDLRHRIEQRYFEWPAAEDNSVLRLARERLLGVTSPAALPTAAHQQGLLQVVRDFCEHSNSICEKCPLPDLVRDWPK